MKHRKPALVRDLVIAVCLALGVASASLAQGRGGPPPGGGPGGGGMGGPGGGMSGPGMGGPNLPNNGPGANGQPGGPPPGQRSPGSDGSARAGLQVGPPGRWWDDKSMIKTLKLSSEQQSHMDAIFEQNRGALLARFQTVQQAEAQMQDLARSPFTRRRRFVCTDRPRRPGAR
jgi:hypothetical protein